MCQFLGLHKGLCLHLYTVRILPDMSPWEIVAAALQFSAPEERGRQAWAWGRAPPPEKATRAGICKSGHS